MSDRAHIGLDNPAFRGRLRQPSGSAQSLRAGQAVRPSARYFDDFKAASVRRGQQTHRPAPAAPAAIRPHAAYRVAQPGPSSKAPLILDFHKPQPSKVLKRPALHRQATTYAAPARTAPMPKEATKRHPHYSKLQFALMGAAAVIFIAGISVTLMTLRTNHKAAAQVAALSNSSAAANEPAANDASAAAGGGDSSSRPPSTVRPSSNAVESYAVGPTLPRYLNIPKLGVHARVLSCGILNNGALATPNNVFDTCWYNESSEPGQPGAELIDGHVSSWTSHGVFYGIKTLQKGDKIQVQRGDGKTYTYKVVKRRLFDHNDVDMQSAITPVTEGKPGLNLITCTGDVIPGTNEFNERIIVYATLE
jgi:LPXTG-site transpeptidase (sortase) family protein